ncbi:BatD family protein [Candidatus Omnitrophota bacterium]
MKKCALVSVFFVLAFAACACAETSLKAEVDKLNMTTDEYITYKLTVTSSGQDISDVEVPGFQGFRIITQTQSSNVSLIKGELKTIITNTYILVPIRTGTFKIEPSKVKMKDKTLKSEPFQIEVKEGKPKPQPEQEPPQPEAIQPDSEEPLRITL